MPRLRSRHWWRRTLFLLAVPVLAACASVGPTSNSVLRTGTWFSYLAGDDVRASCWAGATEAYRIVYNGIYRKRVRTYDVTAEALGARGVMVVRLFQGTVRITGSPFPGAGFVGARARTIISPAEFSAVRKALERGGAFAAGPPLLFLHSSTFYWTVASCSGGRFYFRAFKGPPQELDRLPFARILLRLDETGAAYNPPALTEIDRLTNLERISEPPAQNSFVAFELEARPGRLN